MRILTVIMLNQDNLNQALSFLEETLRAAGAPAVTLVVCGGSALIAQNLISRTTKDVDVVALQDASAKLIDAHPLPDYLTAAAQHVAKELELPDNWLNDGPTDLFRAGLPSGFEDRMILREFGSHLRVFFASRYDQIHFKIYAAADQGPGRHLNDLLALHPTEEEWLAAARWTLTHDDSEAFRLILRDMLHQLGHETVAAQL